MDRYTRSAADIRRMAEDVSINGTATVTGFYERGALVNGGAWIQTPQGKVDFLYRNVEQIQRTIAEAQQGISHIAKNYPILRRNLSSYRHQLERALAHDDLVSINHRLVALLASYFDILFALNRVRHPGEKRLVSLATTSCSRIPAGMAEQIHALLQAGAVGDPMVIDALDDLLRQKGVL